MKAKLYLLKYQILQNLKSPANYLILAILWFLLGWLFGLLIEQGRQAQLSTIYWWTSLISLFLIPALSMNLFSKKNQNQFFMLLRTLNFSSNSLTLIYFIEKTSQILLLNLPIYFMFLWLILNGNPDHNLLYAGLIGLIALQISYLAYAMLVSALSNNAITSLMFSFSSLFLLWLFFYADSYFSNQNQVFAIIIKQISPYTHFLNFLNGSINQANISYFIFMPIFCLYSCAKVANK